MPCTVCPLSSPAASHRPAHSAHNPSKHTGLLTSGIVPCVRHALDVLLTTDAVLLPASATVYMQAVELRTGEVAGLDMSAANLYRWHPAYAAGKL